MKALDICQQNYVFEFDRQLYRQLEGHGAGQKQAPPVACLGAGQLVGKDSYCAKTFPLFIVRLGHCITYKENTVKEKCVHT